MENPLNLQGQGHTAVDEEERGQVSAGAAPRQRQSSMQAIKSRVEDFFTTPDAVDEEQRLSLNALAPISRDAPSMQQEQQQGRLQQRKQDGKQRPVGTLLSSSPTTPTSPPDSPLSSVEMVSPGSQSSPESLDSLQVEHELLVKSGSWEFTLRHTLAYWTSISFAAGSLMFILGGLASVLDLGGGNTSVDTYKTSFVTAPYVVGSCCYTLGCYSGFLAVLNLARKDPPPPGLSEHPFRFWGVMANRRSWWATGSYTIGAVLFTVATLADGYPSVIAVNQVAGSVLFVGGAALEVWHNQGFNHFRPKKLAFWVSWCDLVGSLLFLAGSACGTATLFVDDGDDDSSASQETKPRLNDGLTYTFVVGSAFFLGSSLAGLWMWKLEQYGNTYLPELNTTKPSVLRAVKGYQVFFALVYATILTVAVTGISLSVRCGKSGKDGAVRTQDQVLRVFIPLGLLAVGSIVHATPEVAPFSYLLWWFRVAMLYQLFVEILELGTICND